MSIMRSDGFARGITIRYAEEETKRRVLDPDGILVSVFLLLFGLATWIFPPITSKEKGHLEYLQELSSLASIPSLSVKIPTRPTVIFSFPCIMFMQRAAW